MAHILKLLSYPLRAALRQLWEDVYDPMHIIWLSRQDKRLSQRNVTRFFKISVWYSSRNAHVSVFSLLIMFVLKSVNHMADSLVKKGPTKLWTFSNIRLSWIKSLRRLKKSKNVEEFMPQ